RRCGSAGWAFSSVNEGQHFRKSGTLVSLSEQQLVDCSRSYGNNGCKGGLMDKAFNYIEGAGGIEGELDYPFFPFPWSVSDSIFRKFHCKFQKSKVKATVTGSTLVTKGSESALQAAVATVGPVDSTCTPDSLNHGVLVVGYGSSPKDYWLVKNSWGKGWGKQGYIWIARNHGN
ncbi:CATL-like protein, partial [Mya arenaria]